MELKLDGVNVFNPLEGKLDDVIESFVEFYGEKHRKRITERIKDCKFLFLPTNNFNNLSDEIKNYFHYTGENNNSKFSFFDAAEDTFDESNRPQMEKALKQVEDYDKKADAGYLKSKQEQACDNEFFNNSVQVVNEINPKHGSLDIIQAIYNFMNKTYSGSAFTCPSVSKDGTLKNLVVCPYALNGCDTNLIHEISHVIETTIAEQNNNKTDIACGFDVLTEDINENPIEYDGTNLFENIEKNMSHKKMQYESFNEIINDYFSLETSKIMHNKGINLFLGTQENSPQTSYSSAFPLVKPFINQYRQQLIDARLSDNPLSFQDVIGKENFDLLAQACDQYLQQTSNIDSFFNFSKEILSVKNKTGGSIYEAAQQSVPWSENAQKFIKHFKTIQNVMEAVEEKQNEA